MDGRRNAMAAVLATILAACTPAGEAPAPVATEAAAPGPAPDPAADASIRLERSACYGPCPVYAVTVHADGRATYVGGDYVDVTGEHAYTVPAADVAALVARAREQGLLALADRYEGHMTDQPTYTLTLHVDGATKTIVDYRGETVGMPATVTAFEDAVDAVARSATWRAVTPEAISVLQAEGFEFGSPAGGELLLRALANDAAVDEAGMLALLSLGAPFAAAADAPADAAASPLAPALRTALEHGRGAVVAELLERRELGDPGTTPAATLDAAFAAAASSGDLATAQAIWNHAGDGARPALVFADAADAAGGAPARRKGAPVPLLIDVNRLRYTRVDPQPLLAWLQSIGVDLKGTRANGDTLLHVAVEADRAALVRWLLDQGLDPNLRGEYDLPPLGAAASEDVALMLLQAGADPAVMDDTPGQFRAYAANEGWTRVVALLDARGD